MVKALYQLFTFLMKEIIVETAKGLWNSRPWKRMPKPVKVETCIGECTPWQCHSCRERLIRLSKKKKS